MGWIYNGAEFIKANKAQRKAYDDFKRHELAISGLAQPYTIPTVGALSAALIGGLTLTGITAVLFGPGKAWIAEKEDWVQSKYDAVVKAAVDAGVSTSEQSRLVADGRACMAAAQSPIPGVTGFNFFNCMRKKGLGGRYYY